MSKNSRFDPNDVRANKGAAALGYVLFFIPLIKCPSSPLGRFCANQGLLLTLTYVAVRFALRLIKWLLIFNIVYDILLALVKLGALALAAFMAYRLYREDMLTTLPYIGKYTLIK